MMIVGALDQGSPLGRALSARPLVLLGRLSYSLYLWHFGVFQVVAAHTARGPAPARVLLAWALTTAIAAFSYRYVEGPALALKNRLGGRRWPMRRRLTRHRLQRHRRPSQQRPS